MLNRAYLNSKWGAKKKQAIWVARSHFDFPVTLYEWDTAARRGGLTSKKFCTQNLSIFSQHMHGAIQNWEFWKNPSMDPWENSKIWPKNEKFWNFFWYYQQSHLCPNSQFWIAPRMCWLKIDRFWVQNIFEVRPPLRAAVNVLVRPTMDVYSVGCFYAEDKKVT